MATLKRITLGGMRRFGRETTIEFSRHATILLAPNGTGKTTVFEAIELALTGMISRLQADDALRAVVGDGAGSASVKLEFDAAEASASVAMDGALTMSGDVSGLFPGVAGEDVPYLLRLTHLLDQRERSWFIQAAPKDAGQSLSKLPVGREGAIASAALVPVRKAVTERVKANIAGTQSVIVQLQQWEALVAERDKAASASTASLKPIENIYEELAELALLGSMEDTLAPDWRSSGGKLQALSSFHSTLGAKVSAKQARLIQKTEQLASLAGALQSYQSDKQRLQESSGKMADLRSSIENLETELSGVNSAKESAAQGVLRCESRRMELNAEIDGIRNWTHARHVLNAAREKSAIDLTELQAAEEDLAAIRGEVVKLAAEEEELIRASHQVSSLLGLEASLLSASKAAERWRDDLVDAASLNAEAAEERDNIARLSESHADAVAAHADAGRRQREAQAKYSSASASVGELRRALSLIVANLPVGSEDCPACGVHHGAVELQRRLRSSLSSDSAELQVSQLELREASESAARILSAMNEKLHELQSARSRLSEIQGRLAEISLNADEYARSEHLAGWSTPGLAVDAIAQRLTKVRAEVEVQRHLIDQINRRVVESKGHELRSTLSATQSRVELLRAESRKSRDLVDIATVHVANYEQGSLDRDVLELEREGVALDEKSKAISAEIEAFEKVLSEKVRKMHSLNDELLDAESHAGEAGSRVAVLDSRWRNLSLPGSPSNDVVDASIEVAEADLNFIERSLKWLEAIAGDLEARLSAEQRNSIQELIDQRRGAMQEAAFAGNLRDQKKCLDVDAQELAKLSAALEALSRRLSTEIDSVHDYIGAVVPSWQALLKRIVREPRFSGTTLGLQNRYRRPVASVSVQMNGEEMAAPLIASEAQMTDLQLTFLLSMALHHKWSNWRALLLDDPTQHHDLVHASSVFDVLRDYIVDHGFQLVLATHDAAQARYFKRKLMNDGLEARIWSLVPEDGGVAAREVA
ncbi:AAA family ATPase [Stenotrophomonas sp. Ker107b]